MGLEKELVNFNNKLASQGSKLRIEKRGSRFNIRGPFPCSKTVGKTRFQRISLRIKANQEGLKEAEKIIQLLDLQLKLDQFDWKHWKVEKEQKLQASIKNDPVQAIHKFKTDFFNDPTRQRFPSGTKTTWSSAYLPYIRRLEQIAKENNNNELSKDLLQTVLESYSQNSRSRQQCGTALRVFAKQSGLALPDNWRELTNGYGLNKARFRRLPNDKTIKETWKLIPNKSWKLAYGLMATYGLRNHEIFFSDLSSLTKEGDKVIRVLPTTKTGEHQVWPFYPEWIEEFELIKLGQELKALPLINTDLKKTTLQQVGRRVSEQFKRYKLELTPYDLRHAWAIRTIHFGLPDTVAARMMGHSVAIHTQTYHHWITRRDQQQAVDNALKEKRSKEMLSNRL